MMAIKRGDEIQPAAGMGETLDDSRPDKKKKNEVVDYDSD